MSSGERPFQGLNITFAGFGVAGKREKDPPCNVAIHTPKLGARAGSPKKGKFVAHPVLNLPGISAENPFHNRHPTVMGDWLGGGTVARRSHGCDLQSELTQHFFVRASLAAGNRRLSCGVLETLIIRVRLLVWKGAQ
jgi:hypothetical protein